MHTLKGLVQLNLPRYSSRSYKLITGAVQVELDFKWAACWKGLSLLTEQTWSLDVQLWQIQVSISTYQLTLFSTNWLNFLYKITKVIGSNLWKATVSNVLSVYPNQYPIHLETDPSGPVCHLPSDSIKDGNMHLLPPHISQLAEDLMFSYLAQCSSCQG